MNVFPPMSYSPYTQFGVERQHMTPLDRGFQVDLALNSENQKIVTIRFGHTGYCNDIDDWLDSESAETLKNSVVIYTVEMNGVPELVARYKLSGPFTIIFFFKNTVIYRLSADDFNRRINTDKNKFSDIVNTVQSKISNGSHQNNSTDFYNSVTRPMPPPPPPPAPAYAPPPAPASAYFPPPNPAYGAFAGRNSYLANQNPSPYSGVNIPGNYYTNPQTYEITDAFLESNIAYNPYSRKNWFRNRFSWNPYY